jgi:hypothetical protein
MGRGFGVVAVLLAAFGAHAQSPGDGKARLQVIQASIDAQLAKADIFINDGYPDAPLTTPVGKVSYGRSSGTLDVPAGKHKLVLCRSQKGGACVLGSYELEPKDFGTVVLIGDRSAREEESTLQLLQLPGPLTADMETQRRWRTQTGRPTAVLNAMVDSPPLEVCVFEEGKRAPDAKPLSPFRTKDANHKGEAMFSFGEQAGVGRLTDADTDTAWGTHVDFPTGIFPLQLRVDDETPCAGKVVAETRLEKPETGMMLLIAVGDAERPKIERELLACTEPRPPRSSECFRHRLRDAKPATPAGAPKAP